MNDFYRGKDVVELVPSQMPLSSLLLVVLQHSKTPINRMVTCETKEDVAWKLR